VRHVLSIQDLSAGELEVILDRAEAWRSGQRSPGRTPGPTGVLILERPALRTRIAYETAFHMLGGHLSVFEGGVGTTDSIEDVGRVLTRMVDVALVRTRDHGMLEVLASAAEIPVVNALSDRKHPVEVLADALVLRDVFGDPAGRKIAFVGDGGNVCASVLLLALLLGMNAAVATPEGHRPRDEILARAAVAAEAHGRTFEVAQTAATAVKGASVVYTDGWPTFDSRDDRESIFGPYRVTRELMNRAAPDAVFLHCLPAARGLEVTDEVLDGPRSHAFARLANLAPTSAALIEWLTEETEDKR